uniref:Uncharacterized protein n=1 Tax=Cyprinodon variegatus TaxID=28743 RepID=A0A3Q2CI55_CYPVA
LQKICCYIYLLVVKLQSSKCINITETEKSSQTRDKLSISTSQIELLSSGLCQASDGNWGLWSPWSACTTTCGEGNITRIRLCNNPPPSKGGKGCTGNTRETKPCNNTLCPVTGGWTAWNEWSQCSTSCGGGLMSRQRECLNPAPQNGGKPCAGEATDYKACNKQPSDGNWGLWSPWSACTTTCGEGNITRIRLCNNPPPSKGGKGCTGNTRETKPCNNTLCPVTGGWTAWNEWSQCSTSCGGGLMSRQRECLNPAPQNGGKPCAGEATDYKACNKQPCPVDLCVLSNPCFPGVKCTSKIDGSWECGHCPVGLKGNGTHCEDENEVKGEEERLDYLKWDLIDFVYIFK